VKTTVLFCHGLESGPNGSKYRTLVDAGYDVLAPDCRGKNLTERVALIAPLLREHLPFVVGSSYGGLTAILAAKEAGVMLPGLVLCAPALGWNEAPSPGLDALPLVGPTVVVHGVRDDVVPVETSRRYAERTGAALTLVEDDHRLNESGEAILAALRSLEAR